MKSEFKPPYLIYPGYTIKVKGQNKVVEGVMKENGLAYHIIRMTDGTEAKFGFRENIEVIKHG